MYIHTHDEIKTKTVTLTLTHACNLSCAYCYEKNKQTDTMDFDCVYNIISKELNKKGDYELIILDFFGGEPFLQFDLIKRIVAAVRAEAWENDYLFFAGTNSTLVHGEIQDWLIENSNYFVCGLSYDGTKEMHNINRSNSADLIDINFFLEQCGNEEIKMTVSPETLPMLAEGVIYLHNMGFDVSCNLAYGIDWSEESCVKILEN